MAISTLFTSPSEATPEQAIKFGQKKFGYYQYLKGLKEEEALVRPEYQIPEEFKQNLSQAQLMALEGLPAEQKRQYIENIQRSMTSNLSALTGRKAGLAGVAGLAQTEADSYRQLLGMDVGARQANQQELMNQRSLMGDQKSLQWQINQMQPYLQDYNQAQALQGAGVQNTMQAKQANKKFWMDLIGQGVEAGVGAAGSAAGAAGSAAGTAAIAALSDNRLKKNISFLGKNKGYNIYTFNYLWSEDLSVGVMAQEIEQTRPDCVFEVQGYKAVNYSKLFA